MDVTDRSAALDRLYEALAELSEALGGPRRLAECDGRMNWPRRGVYFFFEDGEFRIDGVTPRIVRVGTHALRPSKSSLWGRLVQHRGNVGGSQPGGGNHRGSIFRSHIGTALLEAGDWPEDVRETWGRGATANRRIREREYPLEVAVSQKIGLMPFLWIQVDDEASGSIDRALIEAGVISLLSNFGRQSIDPPSGSWLGHHAGRESVRESGLWNVEHVAACRRCT